jgi:hypothetical protein
MLSLTLSGLPNVGVAALYAATGDRDGPILRHTPPTPPFVGGALLIHAVVESEQDIAKVNFWYRALGARQFQKRSMVHREKSSYEIRLEVDQELKKGIEYYIEAVDRSGNGGVDGTDVKPYFVGVRESPSVPSLASDSTGSARATKRPLWKNPWFWIGILAAGGGVAALSQRGEDQSGTGTIIVK